MRNNITRRAVLLAGACAWKAAGNSAPAAGELIERYARALGGRPGARGAAGSFHSPTFGSRGWYEEQSHPAGRWVRTVRIPVYGVTQWRLEGARAWEETPEYGIEELSGPRVLELKRDAAIDDPARWKDLYEDFSVAGRASVEGREVFEVRAVSPGGARDKLFFDAASGLLVRRESRESARDGSSRDVSMGYEDYRPVNGVQAAHSLRYVRDDLIWIVRRQVMAL